MKKHSLTLDVTFYITAMTLIIILLSAWPALAREDTDGKKKAQTEEFKVEEMIVTAQKQEENLQEVPMSVTMFNEMDIQDMKIDSVGDLANYIPNLQIFDLGLAAQSFPIMRGISALQDSFSVSTGLFVDGVPVLSTGGYEVAMTNVERIEVLRGPQGTLYGRGAETGVINIITKQPDNEFQGRISAEAGQYLSSESGDKFVGTTNLNLSGPIVKDKFFYDLTGKFDKKDGFIENTYYGDANNGEQNWFGNAKLRWSPSDKLDLTFTVSRYDISEDGCINNNSDIAAAYYRSYGLPVPIPEDRSVSSNLDEYADTTIDTQSLKAVYDFSDTLSLTSITSNWRTKTDSFTDYDFSSSTIMHSKNGYEYKKISQELRLAYVNETGFKWLLGVYYDNDDNDYVNQVFSDYGMTQNYDRNYSGDAYALFGNLTYPVFEKISMVAGLRIEREDKELEERDSGLKLEESWNDISPKLSLNYQVTPEIMTYITGVKGYRSGGFNPAATSSADYTYDPEELWSGELGVKTTLFNNRLIMNTAVFYMKIDDMQVAETLLGGHTINTNAAEATGQGVEIELTARLTKTLTLMGGFGYTDIKFDSFSDAEGDYEGNKNPWAPEYTFNIGAQYRHETGFFARVDLIGYGKMYFDKANNYSSDPYELVNAKIGYETDRFDIYIYGKNIFDKRYDTRRAYDGFLDFYSPPGEVGLQAILRF